MKKNSTKGLWHVNDNGVVTQCRAENSNCPFAHNGHYETRMDAERMAEEILSDGASARTLKNEPSPVSSPVASSDDKPGVFNVIKKLFKKKTDTMIDPSKRHAPRRFEDVEIKPLSFWDGQLELADEIKRDPVATGRSKASECMEEFMTGHPYCTQLPDLLLKYYDSWDMPYCAGNVTVSNVTWGDYAVGDAVKVREYKKAFYDAFVDEAAAGSKPVIELAREAIKFNGNSWALTEDEVMNAVEDPVIMARSAQLIVSTGRAVFNNDINGHLLRRFDSPYELSDDDKRIDRYALDSTGLEKSMYAEMASMDPEDRPHLTVTDDLETGVTVSDREKKLRDVIFNNRYITDSCINEPEFSRKATILDKKNAMLAYAEGWSRCQLAGFRYLSDRINDGFDYNAYSRINVEPLFNRLLLLPSQEKEKIKNARVALDFDGIDADKSTTTMRLTRWRTNSELPAILAAALS